MKTPKPTSPLRVPGFIRRAALITLGAISLAAPSQAAVTEDLQSATLLQTYILDSDGADADPTTNRHTLQTDFEAFFQITSPDLSHTDNYRIAYRLRDSAGNLLTLLNGDTNHPTDPKKWAYTDPVEVELHVISRPGSSTTVNFTAQPQPLNTLDPKEEYRVDGFLQVETGIRGNWETIGVGLVLEYASTPLTPIPHFTNTTSGDDEYNVRASIDNLAWTKTYAVDSSTTNNAFEAEITVLASRWDEFLLPNASDLIEISADFDLIEDSTGNSIPLLDDGINTYSISKFSHDGGSPPSPTAPLSRTTTHSLQPLAQLESASETYTLRCTISHIEDGIGTVFVDSTCDIPSQQLLHFNGNLTFGSINTEFAEISNTPIVLAGSNASSVKTTITVPSEQGSLPNRPELVFGDGSPLSVDLLDSGDAVITAGTQTVYDPSSPATPLTCDHSGIRVDFDSVELSPSGASGSNIEVYFPQGFTYLVNYGTNPYLGESTISSAGSFNLDRHLCPTSDPVFTLGASAAIADESHPLIFFATQIIARDGEIQLDVSSVKYAHDDAFDYLDALRSSGFIGLDQTDRPSNDRYLRKPLTGSTLLVIKLANDQTARIEGELIVGGTTFEPHLPMDSKVEINSQSTIAIYDGYFSDGTVLMNVPSVEVPYYQNCPGDKCTAHADDVHVTQEPYSQEMYMVRGGGLHCGGQITSGNGDLKWGYRGTEDFTHETSQFTDSTFYMPGYQLYADDNTLLTSPLYSSDAADQAAAALLLSSFNRDLGDQRLDLAPDLGYRQGTGDLPGMNFDVLSSDFTGVSRLADDSGGFGYPLLENGAKYYIRLAGVSGRQVANESVLPVNLSLYGFDTNIEQFQLTFLDSSNTDSNGVPIPGTDSWVNGSVTPAGPYSTWSQSFNGLRFDCVGKPGIMTPDLNDADDKPLEYWNSTFDLKSIRFEPVLESIPDECPEIYTAKLIVGAKTRVAHIDQDLYGRIAFSSDGNLSNSTTQVAGVDSQLRIPANIPLTGPNKDYNLVPTGKLRFNNPTVSGAPSTGFVTFAATIDIPYFVDLQVQAITSATPGNIANFYLTPGWIENTDETFFTKEDFDPDHRGFPTGISFANFRSPDESSADQYLIKAEQKLFNLIDLEYPLRWDDTVRRFSSMKSRKQELFITQVEHQVEWMDAKFANISFGAKYDGIPQLKLSNFLNAEIDQAVDIITSEFDAVAKQALDTAMNKMDELLEDSLESIIDPVVDSAAEPLAALQLAITETIPDTAAGNYGTFRDNVEALLTDPDSNSILYRDVLKIPITDKLGELNGAEAHSFVLQLDDALQKVIMGIDAIVHGLETDQFGTPVYNTTLPSNPDLTGLLFKNGEDRNIVGNVINALLEDFVDPDVKAVLQPLIDGGTASINGEIESLIGDINPTLDQIQLALLEVRLAVVAVQQEVEDVLQEVEGATGVAAEIIQVIDDASNSGALDAIAMAVGERAWAKFLAMEASLGVTRATGTADDIAALVDSLDTEEFINLLKDELKSQLMESDITKEMQFLLRQVLYDLQDKISTSLGSTLAQISGVLKEVISRTVGELEEQINPMLGAVSKYMGSGEISGYAEVNGDSLRKLRLDAKMQFELPEEMSLHVFIEILSYSSGDNFLLSGCLEPGEKAVEVRIGAQNVGIDWISDIKADLGVKISLKDDGSVGFPVPIGVGGCFDMTDGTLDFQTFEIFEFSSTIAIGLDECYISTRARARFSNYEVAAGIFFGRTCTLEPLLTVEPDIGDVITAGTTFTGAYVYGEVWLPISELVLGIPASCLFRIDAGVGAGAFYFLEGPTYGGKMFLGVSGEALCLVTIRGEVKMILASQAGNLRGSGKGKFTAKIGWCPFCIKFRKSVKIKYTNGDWDVN